MTLKTDNKKVAYWIITITIIVITFVLINTSMRKVMLARSADGKVYVIDTNWVCGKCDGDFWYFYGNDGSLEKVVAPLKSNYTFIKVWCNKNHYNKKTKTFTFGSYNETYDKLLSGENFYMSSVDGNGFKVYQELGSSNEKKPFFLFIWIILSGFFIALPLIHIRPSKKFFTELMKYASYVEEDDKRSFHHNDGKLQVDLQVTSKEVCFSDVYYKEDRVAHDVHVLSDGTLKNVRTHEYYWIKRATKSILPAFKNKMINTKLKHIF